MRITAEISFYPLTDGYDTAIRDFLARMERQPDIVVRTDAISTRVHGEHDTVMDVLRDAMKRSFEDYGVSIFVCRFIGRDLE